MSLLSVIDALGDEHVYYPLTDGDPDPDNDGYADPSFGQPYTVTARRSSKDALAYARDVLGVTASHAYWFTVKAEAGVERGGRVYVHDDPYRVTRPEEAPYTGFYRFVLVPDDRQADIGEDPAAPPDEDDGFEVIG